MTLAQARQAAAAIGVAAALAACGGGSKVGDKALLNFKDKANQRLGQATTTEPPTTAAQSAKAAVGVATTKPAPPPSAPPATARPNPQAQQQVQQAKQAATLDVAVNADSAGTQFDPSAARVYRGSYIRWVNHDSVARSVVSDDGSTFTSPPIAPGGSWTYQANTPGKFAYHDGTRPYAVATLEVVNR